MVSPPQPGWAARVARPFLALRYAAFRWLWLGQVGQTSAGWAERVTRSWIALELTGSAFQLGALELARGLTSLLVGMVGGVLADRVDRRRLLLVIQTWTLVWYGVLALLALSGQLTLLHLYASAIALALSGAVGQPVRTSMVPSLVPEPIVVNALALNSIATNATRMAAPILVAGLIQISGAGGWGYITCMMLYGLVLYCTVRLRLPAEPTPVGPRPSFGSSFVQGWTFIIGHRPVLTQLLIGFGPLTIGFMYQGLLVVYVAETLGQGAAAYGALYSCAGLGALLGGLLVASFGALQWRGRLLVITGVLNGVAMLALGALGWLPAGGWLFLAAVPCLMVAGGSQTSFRAANNGLLLANTPRELRGRVVSLDEVFRSTGTLLAPALGALADATTPAAAMAVIGAGCLLVIAAVWLWQPRLHTL